MKSLRRAITRRMPAEWQNFLQRTARAFDSFVGTPFAGKQPAVICMFHVGRSGSTVLGDFMDNRDDVYWDGELYERANKNRNGKLSGMRWDRWTKRQFQIARRRIYGFEIKPLADQHLVFLGDMPIADYLDMIERIGVTHYVILKRKNILRRMISQQVGTQTGTRHVEKSSAKQATQVTLDIDNFSFGFNRNKSLLEAIREVDAIYTYLETALQDKPLLSLTYEDDILPSSARVAYEKMCQFLALEPAPSSSKLKRTNPFAIRDMVENYEALAAHLAGTEFEWMLDD